MDILSALPSEGPVSLTAEFTARPGEGEVVAALLAGLAAEQMGVRAALAGVATGGVVLAVTMVFATQLRHVKD